MSALLELNDIERAWRGRPVLEGIDLELTAGQVTWLKGRNGAGKTTLLRIAVGLLAPDRGQVRLAGLDPVRDRRAFQRRMGFLSAGDRGLYARLTVAQQLRLWSDLALVAPHRRAELIGAATKSMGLGELLGQRVDRMSMGQRQRVRIAMTFLHEPDVVLLDEPHTSLDDAGVELLAGLVDRHAARGGALLWCSPGLGLAELRHDRCLVLHEGKVHVE